MPNKQNKTSLVWFRNDLRINDNATLFNAINQSETVIAIYCFDNRNFKKDRFGFKKTEKFRAKFLIETVSDLKFSLQALNIPLFVYCDDTENSIEKLQNTHGFDALYLQKEWTTEENNILNLVKKKLKPNVTIHEAYNQFLFHPEDLNFNIQSLPSVFTQFRKNLEKNISVRAITAKPNTTNSSYTFKNETKIPSLKDLGFSDFSTHTQSAFPFKGGETEALKRLNNYFFETKKLGFYKKTRNGLIGTDYSSKLSPWLANGSISAKTIYFKIKEFEAIHFKNESTYWLIFELLWRDYFKYVSLKNNTKIFKIEGILNKNYQWKNNKDAVNKWINGETNEAFVNANMKELNKTGWMSNRGRQNVASYFSKELLLDWRIGAAYFESLLIDYDVHSNYGNWMYVSGVGNDPRDRKFNVKLQADRYDTNGHYQRLWLQNTLF